MRRLYFAFPLLHQECLQRAPVPPQQRKKQSCSLMCRRDVGLLPSGGAAPHAGAPGVGVWHHDAGAGHEARRDEPETFHNPSCVRDHCMVCGWLYNNQSAGTCS